MWMSMFVLMELLLKGIIVQNKITPLELIILRGFIISCFYYIYSALFSSNKLVCWTSSAGVSAGADLIVTSSSFGLMILLTEQTVSLSDKF